MRDFFNRIKIRNKILLSFVSITTILIVLAVSQYNLYNNYISNEKNNYIILENISLENRLKENLTTIYNLNFKVNAAVDTIKLVKLKKIWEQKDIAFKRTFNYLNKSINTSLSKFEDKNWVKLEKQNQRIQILYDSLVSVNIDKVFTLRQNILVDNIKLGKKEQKFNLDNKNNLEQDTSQLEDKDMVFSSSILTKESSDSSSLENLNSLAEIDQTVYEISENKKQEILNQRKENTILLQIQNNQINSGYNTIKKILDKEENLFLEIIDKERANLRYNFKQILNKNGLLIIITIVLAFILSLWLVSRINIPIEKIKKAITNLKIGNLSFRQDKILNLDELGEIEKLLSESFINLDKLNIFAQSIAQKQLDTKYNLLSDDDRLGKNLISIKEQIQELTIKEKERLAIDQRNSWINDGIAKFNSLLRQYNENLQELADHILGELIKYIKAQQGGFFIIVDGEDSAEYHLELKSSYAYNRRKFYKKKIIKGEGIIGTVAEEGKKVFLSNIPNDYLEIRSGIGGTKPISLLVVPLIINEKVVGVLEIASLKVFENFEIEFIEKISESIAASISSIYTNENTSFLLNQSRKQAEELGRQQQDRQNIIKELQATQQEVEKREQELSIKLKETETEKEKLEADYLYLKEQDKEEKKELRLITNTYETLKNTQNNFFNETFEGVIKFNSAGEILFINHFLLVLIKQVNENCINKSILEILPEIINNNDNILKDYIQTNKSDIIGKERKIYITIPDEAPLYILVKIIDTSTIDEFIFTAIIKDLKTEQILEEKNINLDKQLKIKEKKLNNKIQYLEKLLKTNNIEYKIEEEEEKLILNTDSLKVNNKELDENRERIFKIINSSYNHILLEDFENATKDFNVFIKQVKEYFRKEETILEDKDYSDLKKHTRLHKKFTIKLLEYKNIVKSNDTEKILNFFDEIKNSIINHFDVEDKKIIELLNK